MHGIMERIVSIDDIDDAVDVALREGDINALKAETLKAELRERLADTKVANWFDGSMPTVYTEDVIATADDEKRPDRIMIDCDGYTSIVDYKFGGKHNDNHKRQVAHYLALLRKANFNVKKGYIWYYTDNEIIPVE